MRYRANPVAVEAFSICKVGDSENGNTSLLLENGGTVVATAAMTARMAPTPGDYWVIQSDGYVYVNPKDVFERKYSPVSTEPLIESDDLKILGDGTLIGKPERIEEFREFCRARGKLLG